MDKIALAQELVKLAKSITASDSAMDDILPAREFVVLEDRVDEQTWELARQVYAKLYDRLTLTSGESDALNRLKISVHAKNMPASLHRNSIFKAAHSLGIKLPSSSF